MADGPYTCCQCCAPTWNDDDWCDACRERAAQAAADLADEAFDDDAAPAPKGEAGVVVPRANLDIIMEWYQTLPKGARERISLANLHDLSKALSAPPPSVGEGVSPDDLKLIGTMVARYSGNAEFDAWSRILSALKGGANG